MDLDRTPVRKLEFVEVRSAPARSRRRTTAPTAAEGGALDPTDDADAPIGPLPAASSSTGWSLWSDADS
jgi:hypothetical protein